MYLNAINGHISFFCMPIFIFLKAHTILFCFFSKLNTCSFIYFSEWLRPKRTIKDTEADQNKDQQIEELTQKLKKLVIVVFHVHLDVLLSFCF